MFQKKEKILTKPLEIIDSELYRYIVEIFNEKQNIHSYDIEILATKEATGLTITLKYGENFTHSKEGFYVYKTLKDRGDDFEKFIHEATDECQKVMVAEYFKMMKP